MYEYVCVLWTCLCMHSCVRVVDMSLFVCTCVYIYTCVCLCVRVYDVCAGVLFPQGRCGSLRTTLGVAPCLPTFLEAGFCGCSPVYAGYLAQELLRSLLAPPPISNRRSGITDMC